MRELEDCREEIFHRSRERIRAGRKRKTALGTALAVLVLVMTVLPIPDMERSATNPGSNQTEVMYGSDGQVPEGMPESGWGWKLTQGWLTLDTGEKHLLTDPDSALEEICRVIDQGDSVQTPEDGEVWEWKVTFQYESGETVDYYFREDLVINSLGNARRIPWELAEDMKTDMMEE